MRRLPCQPLVRGGKLGPELADGGGLLLGLRLRRAEPRLERDLAVLQSAGLVVLLLEGSERCLEPGNLAGLILRVGPERANLALVDSAAGKSPSAAAARTDWMAVSASEMSR